MVEKVSISKKELQKVRKNLKEEYDLSIEQINQEIDAEFKNYLYKGFNMSVETFDQLQNLCDFRIDHEVVHHRDGVSYDKRVINLDKDENLAEFVGMMLGDGHIQDYYAHRNNKHVTNYRVELSFNEDESEIISRAEELFLETLGREPTFHSNPRNKGMKLMVYSKDLVERLQELGLKSGNKTENQVSVPDWIMGKSKFQIRCLKGLVDTDGSIYERVPNDMIVQFKNASTPLLNDFRKMCEDQDISTSKGGHRTVQVAADRDVSRFIRLIQPSKSR